MSPLQGAQGARISLTSCADRSFPSAQVMADHAAHSQIRCGHHVQPAQPAHQDILGCPFSHAAVAEKQFDQLVVGHVFPCGYIHLSRGDLPRQFDQVFGFALGQTAVAQFPQPPGRLCRRVAEKPSAFRPRCRRKTASAPGCCGRRTWISVAR